MNRPSDVARAAKTVLLDCLSLPAGAELIIFTDETTLDVASLLARVALEQELQPISLYFPLDIQGQMGKRPFHSFLAQIIDVGATAVLVCLNGSPEYLAFRDYVRKTALDAHCKVAHMPGIDVQTLSLVDVDYPLLLERCELLAQGLTKGREMSLVTRTRNGEEHTLRIPLRPWERLPIVSDGLIQRGSWGNVPSGETYIAPPEGLASGSIVINGSVPEHRLEEGEEIVLSFEAGWLQNWQDDNMLPADHPLAPCIAFARIQNDHNWRNLAEVGLGVNPQVLELSGKALCDEKKYGTFHIALGDNIDMGGQIASAVHCDMVCVNGEVLVDDKALVRGGEIVARYDDWYEDHHTLSPPSSWTAATVIVATALDWHEDETGQLRRAWDTSSGKLCSIPVGRPESARQATRVFNTIHQRGYALTLEELAALLCTDNIVELFQLTYLLQKYGLVRMVN